MDFNQAKQLVTSYVEAYNRFDVAGMLAGLHDEIVFQNVSGGEVSLTTQGKAAFQAQAEQAKSYFTQREQRIIFWQMLDNELKIQVNYTGVVAVDLPTGLNRGDILRLQGKSFFRFADDKITSITDIS